MSAAEGFEEFVAVVEAGSLTAAAEALGLPRATLSRRLARLEERLGVRLLHRTTRRLTLSLAGERLYETARQVVRMAKESEADVQRLDGVPRGLLRVSLPAGLHRPMATWVAEYMRAYPEVQVELVGSPERVDLVGEGFDLALRATEPEDASLVARTLARVRLLAVAHAAVPRRARAAQVPGGPRPARLHRGLSGRPRARAALADPRRRLGAHLQRPARQRDALQARRGPAAHGHHPGGAGHGA